MRSWFSDREIIAIARASSVKK